MYEVIWGGHKSKTQISKRGRPLPRKIIYPMAKVTVKYDPVKLRGKYVKLEEKIEKSIKRNASINSNMIENDKDDIQVSKKQNKVWSEKVYV